MHDGFDVVCDQRWDEIWNREQRWKVDFQELPAGVVPQADWDNQITFAAQYNGFEQWKHDLEDALAEFIGQQPTPHTMLEMRRTVDRHFNDPMFQHLHHDVHVHCDGPNMMSVEVNLLYDDADDFYEDFGIDPDGEEMSDLLTLDGTDVLAMLDLNAVGDGELMEDAYWAIAKQRAGEIGPSVEQAVDEARIIVESFDLEEELRQARKNADDILFAPIEREEDRKPVPQPSPSTADWDAGCYYDDIC